MKTLFFLTSFLLISKSYAFDFLKFGKFENQLFHVKNCAFDTMSSAMVLIKQSDYKIDYLENKGFITKVKIFERIKIFKKEGLEYGNFRIRIPTDANLIKLKAVTGNFDNHAQIWNTQNFEEKNLIKESFNEYNDIIKIPMPSIREGSVFDVSIELEFPGFSNIPTFWFQEFIPVKEVNFNFSYPDIFSYRPIFTGIIPTPINKQSSKQILTIGTGTTITYNELHFEYNQNEIKPMKIYDYLPCPDDYRSSVTFELVKVNMLNEGDQLRAVDWPKVASIIQGINGLQNHLDAGVPPKAINLLPTEKIESDTLQYAKLLVDRIRREITWNGKISIIPDNKLSKVIEQQSGSSAEITLLTYLLLKKVGIPIYLTASSTTSNGKVNPNYPSLNAFNQLLCMIIVNNNSYWFNPANSNSGIGYLDMEDQGNLALLINEQYNTLVPIKQTRNRNTNAINAKIEEDGILTGNFICVHDQSLGAIMRKEIKDTSTYNKKAIKPNFEQVELKEYQIINFPNVHESLTEKGSFESNQAIRKIGNKLIIKPCNLVCTPNLKSIEPDRNVPIDFTITKQIVNKIFLEIPSGYKIISLPKSELMETQDGSFAYKLLASPMDNHIQIVIEIKNLEPIIKSENLNYFNQFIQAVNESLNQSLILEKE